MAIRKLEKENPLPVGGEKKNDAERCAILAVLSEASLPDWYTSEGDGNGISFYVRGQGSASSVLGGSHGFRCLNVESRGVGLTMMIDTGATVNLIKKGKVSQIQRVTGVTLPSKAVNFQITGLGGSSIRCTQAVIVPMRINGKWMGVCALVTPDNWGLQAANHFDGVLGQDFLDSPGIEFRLFRDGQPIDLDVIQPPAGPDTQDEKDICCTVPKDIELVPGFGVHTFFESPDLFLQGVECWEIFETRIPGTDCLINECLSDPSSAGLLAVTLRNHGNDTLRLSAGDKITLKAQRVVTEPMLSTGVDRGGLPSMKNQQKLVTEVAEADSDELDMYLRYNPSVVIDKPVVYNKKRGDLLCKLLNHQEWELKGKQKEEAIKWIHSVQAAFHLPTEPLGTTHVIQHHIETGDAKPIRVPDRFIPIKIREAVETETKGLLRNGQAEVSTSPWNSSIVMVKRKHGAHYRMCINYKPLNLCTSPEYFPIPRVEDILSRAARAEWFSSLDLRSAYSQVPLTEESIPKTAFSTHQGNFAYRVMPFGLSGAPATFQKLMHLLFHDLTNDGLSAFLDNIDLFNLSFAEHMALLDAVFKRLIEANLKLSPEKTFLFRKSMKTLGHMVKHNQILPEEDKIIAIKNFAHPKNKTDVRSFLGLTGYYRRFVKNYSTIARPLSNLTQDEAPFVWTGEEEEAFQTLKQKLCEYPVLTPPDPDRPFAIFSDASLYAAGAVLSQRDEDSGKYLPIAYFSRLFKGSEKNYLIWEKEAYAVYLAVMKFKPYIWGQDCDIFTDNAAITYLFGKECEKSSRAARWSLNLHAYPNLKIHHLPGRCNVVADALSRPPDGKQSTEMALMDCVAPMGSGSFRFFQRGPEDPAEGAVFIGAAEAIQPADATGWNIETLKKKQSKDPVFGPVITYLKNPRCLPAESILKKTGPLKDYFLDGGGLLYKMVRPTGNSRDALVVPKGLIHLALEMVHSHINAGHPGPDRTLWKARQYFYWPKMVSDVKAFVKGCDVCNRCKTGGNPRVPLLSFPIPEEPWETVSMDLVGPLPLTERGNRYLLVMIDHLSRYTCIEALPSKSARDVALGFEAACKYLRFPRHVLVDNGKEFRNAVFQKMQRIHGFDTHFTAVYHAASNGLVERKNRDVVTTLRAVMDTLHEEWDACIPAVQLCLNSAYHRSIGDTPFWVMFKTDPSRPQMLLREIPQSYDPDVKYALAQRIYETVREQLKKSQEEYQLYRSKKVSASREPLTVGARVFVKNVRRKSKLAPLWLGPMRILQEVGPAQFKLRDLSTGRTLIRHREHLIVKRQADMNRWLLPETDEPFPHKDLFGDTDEEDVPADTYQGEVDDDSSDDSDSDDEIPPELLSTRTPKSNASGDLYGEPVGDPVRIRGREGPETTLTDSELPSTPDRDRLNLQTTSPATTSTSSNVGLREGDDVDDYTPTLPHRTFRKTLTDHTPDLSDVESEPPDWSDGEPETASSNNPGESSPVQASPPSVTPKRSKDSFVTKLRKLGKGLRNIPRVDYNKLHKGKYKE